MPALYNSCELDCRLKLDGLISQPAETFFSSRKHMQYVWIRVMGPEWEYTERVGDEQDLQPEAAPVSRPDHEPGNPNYQFA
ncbi:MAG: hypothetical protein A3B23_02870 [Candidatus Colwellbacteria bacterium RIFCSPLOWO2_01_FULL_48_10]|uniref:Uncharacterized protein n=1 Tax=Candidatus Colwellbacteria bacterium RIFCSPLOWO2_01_FULL_48_10 TaxID=1797690 RepID=A0A1G1Z598_9BACT|nr:MAG: hypothetical protein A3B23_02870 [Candidatus Colwellbacteria bacterium RIFCSPLOWO2_01_FULL_48_10]